MLKFNISRGDLGAGWKFNGTKLTKDKSWIEPYSHPFLAFYYCIDEKGVCLLITEANEKSQVGQSYIEVVSYESFSFRLSAVNEGWSDWLCLCINLNELKVEAGSVGTAPVYLVEYNNRLIASWDPSDLYAYLSSEPLDVQKTIHYLANFNQPYSRHSVLNGLTRLTSGSHAIWNNRLFFQYPDFQVIPKPKKLKKGVDPVAACIRILKEFLEFRVDSFTNEIHTHLSGGFDSGIVAAIASKLGKSIFAYSLIQPGFDGHEQKKRCIEFTEAFGLSTCMKEMVDYPLFHQSYSRSKQKRVIPWEECYSEAFEDILKTIQMKGGKALLMGTGGDELLYPHWEELKEENKRTQREWIMPKREDLPYFLTNESVDMFYDSFLSIERAPLNLVSSSALDDKAITASQCLRHGVWPIHPLTFPPMVKFCRSLPLNWRNRRKLFRVALKNLGCSEIVTEPKNKETFSPFMRKCLTSDSRKFIEPLFVNSILAEQKIIDHEKLVESYQLFCNGNNSFKPSHFYSVAILELTLKSIMSKRSHSQNDQLNY